MRPLFLTAALAAMLMPLTVSADSVLIDTTALPSKEAYGVAKLTPLAMSDGGAPSVILLSLDAGEVVPAHAAETGLRFLTVLLGDVSWGDGDTIVEAEEKLYRPGDMITIAAGDPHWLAARGGPVVAQLILLHNETPVPAIEEQIK